MEKEWKNGGVSGMEDTEEIGHVYCVSSLQYETLGTELFFFFLKKNQQFITRGAKAVHGSTEKGRLQTLDARCKCTSYTN